MISNRMKLDSYGETIIQQQEPGYDHINSTNSPKNVVIEFQTPVKYILREKRTLKYDMVQQSPKAFCAWVEDTRKGEKTHLLQE